MNITAEIGILYDTVCFINNIVNNSIFDLLGSNNNKQVMFKTRYNYLYFCVGVVELIRKRKGESVIDTVSSSHHFGRTYGTELRRVVNDFNQWLEAEDVENVWFPSIDKKLTVELSRYDVVYICANYSKHTVKNLSYVCGLLKTAMESSGNSIDSASISYLVREFFEHYEGVLVYHSSVIAKFLNDIRWAIQGYLAEEYRRSIVYRERGRYEFTFPEGVVTDVDRYIYWELMNEIRAEPYVERFAVSKSLRAPR